MSIDFEKELGRFNGDRAQAKLAQAGIAWSQAWRELYGELPIAKKAEPIEAPTIIIDSPEKRDRQIREALHPFVQEYKAATSCTPDLINYTWSGIWKVISDRAEFDYSVSASDRTTEELAQLKKENKVNLLVPDGIYTPDGLVRLGRAFPLMRSWTTDPKEAVKIFHSPTKGGSIDIEMNLDAPYRTSEGYKQQELVDRITADSRLGQRLPTYLVGSQFSQLLTGQYFDINTLARLPGSSCEGSMLLVFFGSDGKANVSSYWFPRFQDPFLGGRSEGVKRA